MESRTKSLIVMFACKNDEEVARVIDSIGLPLAGLALEGIICTMARGDDLDDD